MILIMVEDEEEDDGKEEKEMELSVFLAGDLTQSNTMKLQGWVKGRHVLVLIDSGVSHNLI